MLTEIKERLDKIIEFFDENLNYTFVLPMFYDDYTNTYFPYFKKALTSFDSSLNSVKSTVSTFSDNFNAYVTNITKKFDSLLDVQNRLISVQYQIREVLNSIREFYYPNSKDNTMISWRPIQVGWRNFFSTFEDRTFDTVLLEVQQKIEDKVNPVSENNKESYDAAITDFKDNTFFGSVNEMATTFPEQLKSAMIKDSSPVLQFKTYGVSNSYFTLPAKTYSIDFSWYAPFKGTADTVISCFMYLGFLWILFKRLPEILHGAGVMRDNYYDFQEVREFNSDEHFIEPQKKYEFYFNGQWHEGE